MKLWDACILGCYVFKKMSLTDPQWPQLFSCLVATLSLSHYLHNLHFLCTVAWTQRHPCCRTLILGQLGLLIMLCPSMMLQLLNSTLVSVVGMQVIYVEMWLFFVFFVPDQFLWPHLFCISNRSWFLLSWILMCDIPNVIIVQGLR